jgi:2,5-diketo-D-gluconate reductase A
MPETVAVPTVELNNGVSIPQLGFGVFQVTPDETAATVTAALDAGYRHIDTAQMYGNEKQVGEAITAYDIDPAEVFVTSKLNNGFHAYDDALRAFDQSLADLQREQIDLFLIHWPLPEVGFDDAWRALEKVYADGRARAIGVSNFQPHHLRRLHEEFTVPPAVNQIEVHPYLTQTELLAFDAEHQIATEAWSPIAQGLVLTDPVIVDVAERYQRTPAQVVLRWHIQLGNIVFPKSTSPARMAENFAIFDFELDQTDLALISALNRDERTGPNPDEFNWIPGQPR